MLCIISHFCAFHLLEVFQLYHFKQTLIVLLQLTVSFGRQSLIERRSPNRVDHSELRRALLQLQLQLGQPVQLGQTQLGCELLSEDEVVLELMQSRFGLSSRLLLLR